MWVLPGIYRANAVLLGWERLVLGHIMRRVIAFDTPNLRVVSKVCSRANSRVETQLMSVPGAFVILFSGFFIIFLFLYL